MYDITNESTDDFKIYAGTLVMFIDSIFISCFVVVGVAERLRLAGLHSGLLKSNF